LIQSRSDVTQINERLSDHRAELSDLQSEHIVALHEAARRSREAQEAEELVESLKNPYTIRNILQWVVIHGPRLLLIVVGMFVLNRFASLFAYRSIQLVSKSAGRGSKAERENRAKTLVGVFQNAATVGIFITGFLMILEELGANITVLMGGVAVVGLAVAFGAQNLIKDYFYGFVMLLENQYMLNDTVRIGGLVGQVERITLRMTVLRDSSGVVHFVPNGTINSVSNETHGWSRATIEVGIGQQDDFEKIETILVAVALELRDDLVIGKLLLDTPTPPMLDSLGSPSIQLKMSVKTMPNKHGIVKQEWLRRVKRALSSNRSFESESTQPHESGPHTLSYRPKDAA
jgi:small conductance mechanosensitive channel